MPSIGQINGGSATSTVTAADGMGGRGYTLAHGLRALCTKIGDTHYRMAAELHDLLRQVANPNVHGLDKELTFRVCSSKRLGSTVKRSAPFR